MRLFEQNHRILTLYNIKKFQTECFTFTVNNSLLPSNPIDTFLKNMNIYDHNTRNKLYFHVIPHSQTVREFSIKMYVVKLWNNLPEI